MKVENSVASMWLPWLIAVRRVSWQEWIFKALIYKTTRSTLQPQLKSPESQKKCWARESWQGLPTLAYNTSFRCTAPTLHGRQAKLAAPEWELWHWGNETLKRATFCKLASRLPEVLQMWAFGWPGQCPGATFRSHSDLLLIPSSSWCFSRGAVAVGGAPVLILHAGEHILKNTF